MKIFSEILVAIIALVLFSSCKEKLAEPILFFENYDLKSGKYRLEGHQIEGEIIDDFTNFYIDDPETLITMQKQWIFKYKSGIQPCGYGYSIVLKENNKIIKQTLVNIDCEYMSGWIYFPKEYLTDYKNHFVKMK
ncbi:hypothetical protein OF897_06880 [Chryseobacterium formosus]|uniref:Lipoprotein n=1 Tax=Chryseobacterium formosus TaxID=1537363 RepID=A0ABT3XTE8_9FLAO|nr:hypothetical protein [Chryseobacterium formosus]MCX8523644.1 hypothetical protein [Chryseobacterium formosus]